MAWIKSRSLQQHGLSLLTITVVRESELTKFVNLTDMQVISLLEGQRERLKTKSKCPYCMRKFECQGAQKTKETEESDKEICMSNTDMMLSLVTSKPGKSRVFPDENTSPVVDKPKKKKNDEKKTESQLKRLQRNLQKKMKKLQAVQKMCLKKLI